MRAKKILTVILAAVLLLTLFLPVNTVFAENAGDINMDGKVNNKDLIRLFQYLSKWNVTVDQKALDVNGDGQVNNKDLSRLLKYISGWDVNISYGTAQSGSGGSGSSGGNETNYTNGTIYLPEAP